MKSTKPKASKKPQKTNSVATEDIQAASTRVQKLTGYAKQLCVVNHPPQPIDMTLIKEHDLDVTEAELPVLQQLVRDQQDTESVVSEGSDAEGFPKTVITPPELLEIPKELNPTPAVVEAALKEVQSVLTINNALNPTTTTTPKSTNGSPEAKRAKVTIVANKSASPAISSPVIRSKKPDRSMEVTPSPLANMKGKENFVDRSV